ncbi:hypothetical protein [Rossellomorea sp. NRS-1567]|uniref:hypothetical protein n=1 Tax=Rossellomorea sp. NRS-1567 TaxID=3233901 RepID=UPI003D2A91E0
MGRAVGRGHTVKAGFGVHNLAQQTLKVARVCSKVAQQTLKVVQHSSKRVQ